MADEKEHIGFDTPAKQLEAKFKNIQEELSKKKVYWENVGVAALIDFKRFDDLLNKIRKAKHVDSTFASTIVTNQNLSLATLGIALLGEDLTSIHERLAGMEKHIENIKLILRPS